MTSKNVDADDIIQEVVLHQSEVESSSTLCLFSVVHNELLSEVVRALGFRNIARNRFYVFNIWNRYTTQLRQEPEGYSTQLLSEEEYEGRLHDLKWHGLKCLKFHCV